MVISDLLSIISWTHSQCLDCTSSSPCESCWSNTSLDNFEPPVACMDTFRSRRIAEIASLSIWSAHDSECILRVLVFIKESSWSLLPWHSGGRDRGMVSRQSYHMICSGGTTLISFVGLAVTFVTELLHLQVLFHFHPFLTSMIWIFSNFWLCHLIRTRRFLLHRIVHWWIKVVVDVEGLGRGC